MLENSKKEIVVKDYMKGTRASTFRFKVVLGMWAFTALAAIPVM